MTDTTKAHPINQLGGSFTRKYQRDRDFIFELAKQARDSFADFEETANDNPDIHWMENQFLAHTSLVLALLGEAVDDFETTFFPKSRDNL